MDLVHIIYVIISLIYWLLNNVRNVNTFMVNVGRSKRWTRASVYRMMPWQHPSARKILPRKVLLKNAWLFDVATMKILFFSTALCTSVVTHYAYRHKVKHNMYI